MKIDYKLDYEHSIYPEKIKKALHSAKCLLAGRLSPIFKEIKLEEEKSNCGLVIHYSDINDKFEFGFYGYSEGLVAKLKESLNEDFGHFITAMMKEKAMIF